MSTSQPMWVEKKDEGNFAFKTGDYDRAIQCYTEAIDEQPNEATLFSNRSAAYLKKGKYAEATRDAEAAIASDPSFLKAYPRLHNGLCNLGKFTDASRAMEKGIQYVQSTNPVLSEDMSNLNTLRQQSDAATRALEAARQCISENNLKQAEAALAESYKMFPECPTLAFAFAEARAPVDPDQVTMIMQRYSRTHDSDPHYLYVRALTTYYKGQDGFPMAQKILRTALEFDPDNTNARILLKKIRTLEQCKENGNTAFKERRFHDAVKFYSEAIDLDGGNRRMNATLRGNRSAAHLELRDFQKALLDCDFAINNGNDVPKMFARRSRIYESLERLDDALRDLQQAVERDSDSYEGELRQLKARIKRSKRKDYYKILGIEQRGATEEIIKRGYKKAALLWHPDKWAHSTDEEKATAEAKFKDVGEAFAVLSDPKKKHMYDNGQLDDNVEGSGMGGGFGGGQEDIMNMFNMMFAGGGMGGMGGMGGGRRGRGQAQGFPPGFSFSFQ